MDEKVRAYQTSDTLGKSQLELIIKVYDGAIGAYRQAITDIENNRLTQGRESLEKAKKFITHLFTTLNMEKGGEIAQQLSQLYAFVINQTNILEATKDLKEIDDIINVLENLRQGWVELKQNGAVEAQTEIPQANRESVTFTTSA